MPLRKLIVAAALLLLITTAASYLIIGQWIHRTTIAELVNGQPERLVLERHNPFQSKYYYDQKDIQDFDRLVKDKGVTISNEPRTREWFQAKQFLVQIYYNTDKAKGMLIDPDGRIYIGVDKGDIHNQSRFHWLWWKVDNLFYKSNLYYVTEPDPKVAEIVGRIKERAGFP